MTTQPAYLTQTAGTSRYLTQTAGTNYYLTLQDPAAYANDVDLLLAEAVWYIDAHDAAYDGGQTVPNAGTAGTALNALLGGGTAVTTNDPKWLAYSATDGAYVYTTGVSGNFLSVPDAAPLDITGDIDIRVRVAMDDWTPAAASVLAAKRNGATSEFSWTFFVNTTGTLSFNTSATGTAAAVSTTSSVAPTVSDGAALWVRVTMDVDNGSTQNEVKYYTSPANDGVTWTQLGTTVTTAGVTSIYSGSGLLTVGAQYSAGQNAMTAGKFYRAIVKSGIDGTTVLDVDTSVLTSGSQTTFTEQSSNAATVTVNRSTSGRKTTLVGGWAGGGSLWLLGTDDYFETPDADAIDFGASDDFTVLVVNRQPSYTASQVLIAKKTGVGATVQGYAIRNGPSTAAAANGQFNDGTVVTTITGPTRTAGALNVDVMVRNVASDNGIVYAAGVAGSPSTDLTTGTIATAEVLRIGRLSGAGTTYADIEFTAAAIWRRALTANEIAALSTYFTTRAYNQSY